jgi:hypothetical protein
MLKIKAVEAQNGRVEAQKELWRVCRPGWQIRITLMRIRISIEGKSWIRMIRIRIKVMRIRNCVYCHNFCQAHSLIYSGKAGRGGGGEGGAYLTPELLDRLVDGDIPGQHVLAHQELQSETNQ